MAAAPKSPGRAASARYQAEVAASRARFLSAEAIDPGTVRRPILASWRRSLGQNVAADKVQMSYDRDVRHDTRLGRSSAPVLRALSERLEGQPVSVVLTDQRGLVLERLTGDRDLERHLDRVLLAPGFSYAEDVVGTNGIGTALEMGGPAHVFGHEHYAEDLEELACAGVPIHDPVSGRLVGAIDLTCWRRDSGSLLLTVAKTTAEQIREALTADSDASQMRVFQEYLRASRHGHGIVLAVHDDMLMINERGRSSLEPADQTAVLAHAAEARSSRQDRTVAVDLPSGQRARLDCRTVGGDDQAPGVVVHVKLDPHDLPDQEHRRSMAAPMALPGLVGSAAQWRHACRKVEEAFRAGEWLAVAGEDGVGKLALLQAVHLRRFPVGRYAVLDARTAPLGAEWLSEVRREFRQSVDTVILRHVDSLDTRTARGLCDVLRHARDIGGDYQLDAIEITTDEAPTLSVLWLHGLGADGHDFEPIVPELRLRSPVRFVFPHAPLRRVTINGGMAMRAWYDILGFDRHAREDAAGIRASAAAVTQLIDREVERGIPAERIVLAGFSQGGAVALHTALREPRPLAGVMALSTYLPLAPLLAAERSAANAGIPIFMAHGTSTKCCRCR